MSMLQIQKGQHVQTHEKSIRQSWELEVFVPKHLPKARYSSREGKPSAERAVGVASRKSAYHLHVAVRQTGYSNES
tara:strand:+ start:490 stop:717 length:228 start_codon:yes stop_codon:yes gene_type:complete